MEVVAKAGLPSVGVTPTLAGNCPRCSSLFILHDEFGEDEMVSCSACGELFLIDLSEEPEIDSIS